MTSFLSGSIASLASATLLLALAGGCAGTGAARPSSTVEESDFGRLTAVQATGVASARSHLALAQDELARAKLSAVNDQHEGALARADQATASADASRATAEGKIGKDSNEPGQMRQAREDTRAAQQGKAVADARLQYSQKLATSRAAQVDAAQRKVDLMNEKVNLAKLQSLEDAAIPAAGKYDRAATMQRVVDAQRKYDQAIATAAKASGETRTAKEHWQTLEQERM